MCQDLDLAVEIDEETGVAKSSVVSLLVSRSLEREKERDVGIGGIVYF
jgi:hypothetical protein